jgi:4-hydroxy-tetrahydrodipicolinate synthase
MLQERYQRRSIAIAPTAFDARGGVDLNSMTRLVRFYEASGLHGLTLLGGGEAHALSREEQVQLLRHVLRTTSLSVFVEVDGSDLEWAKRLVHEALADGAAGAVLGPAKTPISTIGEHVGPLADALGSQAPFIIDLQGLGRADVQSVRDLVGCPSACIGIRHDSSTGLDHLTLLRCLIYYGAMQQVPLFCEGGVLTDYELSRGVDGIISAYAYPELFPAMVRHLENGARDATLDLFDVHLPLLRYASQAGAGLTIQRQIYCMRGIFNSGRNRAEMLALSDVAHEELAGLVRRLAKSDPQVTRSAAT